MADRLLKRFLHEMHYRSLIRRHDSKEIYRRFIYGFLYRFQSQVSKSDNHAPTPDGDYAQLVSSTPQKQEVEDKKKPESDTSAREYTSGDEEFGDSKWKLELAWLTRALEPALQICKKALPTGNGFGSKMPPSGRSLMEVIANIQRSKIGIEGWSLSDLTIGLYLIYLRQTSLNPFEDVKGVQISSESIVHDLIYHIELAKGSYKANISALVRNTMLRENNILKFVKDSSVMRPGYYIGIDPRKKLVILAIRGTHTVYDLITDIVSSSDGEVTFEGYSTHFGTAEAARWFLTHELGTIRKCLQEYEGFRFRLVGHSLGGATASLLAIMLREKSRKELGFSPDIISAIGYATPPCVSRELAESCSDFVKTVVMQDDIIPRLSAASLARLRSEILQTDWMSVVEKGDWRRVIGLVTNAKQVVSSVQDVARKLADYANFGSKRSPYDPTRKESSIVPTGNSTTKASFANANMPSRDIAEECEVAEELFVPGTVYCLKRNINSDIVSGNGSGGMEFFTLWERHPDEHFQRIVLSGNIISDHKCDSHYYALRDVLKGLPGVDHECIFQKNK